jgi:hypothetical protein
MVDGIAREAGLGDAELKFHHDERVPFLSAVVTADFFPKPSFIQWKCPPEFPERAVRACPKCPPPK